MYTFFIDKSLTSLLFKVVGPVLYDNLKAPFWLLSSGTDGVPDGASQLNV